MKPVERVRTRAWAYDVLGVPVGADADAIRAAWRRATFEKHPDRNGGDQSRFIQAKSAYDFLCQDDSAAFSQHEVAARAERMPRRMARPERARPKVEARVHPLEPTVVSACAALFEPQGEIVPAAHMRLQPDAPLGRDAEVTDHVVRAVQRQGRALTYLVSGPLAHGTNRVALPTALLESTRSLRPEVLAISTTSAGKGTVTVPDAVRSRLFPGARTVRIRFGTAVEAIAACRNDVAAS